MCERSDVWATWLCVMLLAKGTSLRLKAQNSGHHAHHDGQGLAVTGPTHREASCAAHHISCPGAKTIDVDHVDNDGSPAEQIS